ncbi:hypothetical protein HDU97_002737 [Phlyctochytrium planicorne]|nr:hypothetical protein HDU97_002737 [Phlyctochytrium planicorne]
MLEAILAKLARVLEVVEAVLMPFVGKAAAFEGVVVDYPTKFGSLKEDVDGCVAELLVSLKDLKVADAEKSFVETARKLFAELERDRLVDCVQCGLLYREKDNGDSVCVFLASADVEAKGRHAAVHHRRFEYLKRSKSHAGYRDHEAWISVSQDDHSIGASGPLSAMFGRLKNGLLAVWFLQAEDMLFVTTFDQIDLEAPTKIFERRDVPAAMVETWNVRVVASRDGTSSHRGYLKAVWNVLDGRIVGLCLEVKAPSAAQSNISRLDFAFKPLRTGRLVEIRNDRKSAMDIAPERTYSLPVVKSTGKRLPKPEFFEVSLLGFTYTQISGDAEILPQPRETKCASFRVKVVSPVLGNPDGSNIFSDNFRIDLRLISTLKPNLTDFGRDRSSDILKLIDDGKIRISEAERLFAIMPWKADEPVMIVGVNVEISFDGDADRSKTAKWMPASDVKVVLRGDDSYRGPFKPLVLDNGGFMNITVEAVFDVEGKWREWRQRVFLARGRSQPVFLRITFEERMGRKASVVMPFRNSRVQGLATENERDFKFVYLDDLEDEKRDFVRVSRSHYFSNDDAADTILFVLERGGGEMPVMNVTPALIRKWMSMARMSFVPGTQDGKVSFVLKDLSDSKLVTTGHFDLSRSNGCMWGLTFRLLKKGDPNVFVQESWVIPRHVFTGDVEKGWLASFGMMVLEGLKLGLLIVFLVVVLAVTHVPNS